MKHKQLSPLSQPSYFSLTRTTIFVTSIFLFTALFAGSVAALPPRDDMNPGNPTDRALDCLINTTVQSFTATPATVAPFNATSISWNVDVPPGCALGLSIAGKNVARSGSMSVTPIWEHVNYTLVGKILGGSSILTSTPVDVDISRCTQTDIPELFLHDTIVDVVDEYDANEDDFYQIAPPEVSISPTGLSIEMLVKASSFYFDPTVRLKMRLKFLTRNGIVIPRFTFFRPDASTTLPDDWVESKFYNKSDDILATFKEEINANETLQGQIGDDKLFSLETISGAIRATICPVTPLFVFGKLKLSPISVISPPPGNTRPIQKSFRVFRPR